MGKWSNETRIETTVKGIEMFMDELGGRGQEAGEFRMATMFEVKLMNSPPRQ